MALTNLTVNDISSDVTLTESQQPIQDNFDDLLENDEGLDTRLVEVETKKYGDLYAKANTNTTTLTTQNTWYQFTHFATVGVNSGVTPSIATDDITLPTAGVYAVAFTCSFSGSASETYEISVFKNNGVTEISNIRIERVIGVGGDLGASAASGFIDAAANDTIELWVRCTSGSSKTVTLRDVNLSVLRV